MYAMPQPGGMSIEMRNIRHIFLIMAFFLIYTSGTAYSENCSACEEELDPRMDFCNNCGKVYSSTSTDISGIKEFIICPSCQAELGPEETSCVFCGQRDLHSSDISAEKQKSPDTGTILTCPKCGVEIPGKLNFCSNCGKNLSEIVPDPAFNPPTESPLHKPQMKEFSGKPESILLKMESLLAVRSNPSRPTLFSVHKGAKINGIMVYHYNNGSGSVPGQISIHDAATGEEAGRWNAVASKSFPALSTDQWPTVQGDLPYLYWTAKTDLILGPGEYEVKVSTPQTWSTNHELNEAGCTWIYGISLDE